MDLPLRMLVKQGVQWLSDRSSASLSRQAVRESFVLASRSPGPCHFPGFAPPCSHVPMFPCASCRLLLRLLCVCMHWVCGCLGGFAATALCRPSGTQLPPLLRKLPRGRVSMDLVLALE
jgi:hypothetical protein